jgi:hypothetical protein
VVATAGQGETVAAVVGVSIEDVIEAPLTPDEFRGNPELDLGLSLYQFPSSDMDPLEVAAELNGREVEAAPNYLTAFAPNWKYAPYDDPVEAPEPELASVAIGEVGTPIAVLDTGYAELPASPAALQSTVVPLVLPAVPGGTTVSSVPEVLDGRVAGHGTFIVNVLAQLLPGATIWPVALTPRFDDDDAYDTGVDNGPVSVRDDSTVAFAIDVILATDEVRHINLSGGTYGCTPLSGSVEQYHVPLGLRRVVDLIETRNAGRDEQDRIHLFAASGNDQQRPGGAVFYPAGFASAHDWLHSVASDRASDGTDYSNRGDWVEFQAAGSHMVSYLPETNRPVPTPAPEGWYAWSGTSFATPCLLASAIVDPAILSIAPADPGVGVLLSGDDAIHDCGITRPG